MECLNEYIERKCRIEPSPHLVSTIQMNVMRRGRTGVRSLWQSVAVAASVAAVVLLGISIGNGSQATDYLSINDYRMENFSVITGFEN